jgi:hypothetical protein
MLQPLAGLMFMSMVMGSPVHEGPGPTSGSATMADSIPAEVRPDSTAIQADPPAPLFHEALLELRLGRIARKLIPVIELNGETLLPVEAFLDVAEIGFSSDDEGMVRAILQPGSRRLDINPALQAVRLGDVPILEGDRVLLRRDGRTWISLPALEQSVDVTIRVDWIELTAVISSPDHLPVARRLAREERRRSIQQGTEEAIGHGDSLSPLLEDRAFGGLAMDWSTSFSLREPGRTLLVGGAVGMPIGGGALQVATRSVGPASAGRFRHSASYQLSWPERTWLTQLRVGDGLSSGPRPRTLRGLHLTNAPRIRSSHFGTDAFTGRVQPGWEVEATRNGVVLDFTRADETGAFALDIPLRYGETGIQVVAFGPHGEVVTAEHLVPIRGDRLPAGRFEWGLGAGACDDRRCDAAGNVDLRFGVSNRLTVRAGAEAFMRDTLPNLVHPYAELSGTLHRSLQLSAEAVGGTSLRGTVFFTPSTRLRTRIAVTGFNRNTTSPVLVDARRRSVVEGDLFWRPLPDSGHWTVQASWTDQRMDHMGTTRWQLVSGFQLSNGRLEGGMRSSTTTFSGIPGESDLLWTVAFTGPAPPLGGLGLRNAWFRTELDVAPDGKVEGAAGRLTQQVSRGTQFEFSGNWTRRFGIHLSISLSADLGHLYSVTRWLSDDQGRGDVVQAARGTMQWNGATGGLEFGSTSGLGQSGISGYVYLDREGNGVRDPDDPGVPGVQLVVAGQVVTTDSEGHYSVQDLPANGLTTVTVNQNSMSNPTWIPAQPQTVVSLAAAGYRRLDLPLTTSGEIQGRMTRIMPGGGVEPVPGKTIRIEAVDRPLPPREVTTFGDGGFYAMGIPPGRYVLRIDPAEGSDLRLEAGSSARVEVHPVVDGDGRGGEGRLAVVIIHPTDRPPADD